MPSPARDSRSNDDLIRANRGFYESLWADAHLMEPQRFNTWPLVRELVAAAPRRLEVAPGLRPRLPLEDTCFIDLSHAALRQLRQRGANAAHGMIGALPCANASFELVCALDILEHVADDEGALRELARVAAPGATVLLSVPLHQHAWTAFDEFVGHCRRYEPDRIMTLLAQHGFTIEQSAVYGMQPKSSRLLELGQWFLVHRRQRAMWWYNRVFMPLGVRFQKPLQWRDGMGDTEGVDELLLRCRFSPSD
ncbi:methyltransferase type 11 [Rhodanobacter sp. Root627]|uniref:methyltransferase domain-containing protein n=1 Tax=Rhodanobacter sp. Root627 TaxID=1736572 RepID=UPI00070218CB|nr:methyltransferase domain-containing protein [Rhodanobacter sp. Root627]KRA32968.1 methyltransferase type 11 [Rhodanobacter sp. Root627]